MLLKYKGDKMSDENISVVAIIAAKKESSRLRNKNIYTVSGKPMIHWALKACEDSKYNIKSWVSSDSNDILKLGVNHGAVPYKRNSDLCLESVEKFDVVKDVVTYINEVYFNKPDLVISLQPNSPEIKGEHLDLGIETILRCDKNEIFSVNDDMMQNGAFSIMKWDYVLAKAAVSTHCGVVVCNLTDVHFEEDAKKAEKKMELYY